MRRVKRSGNAFPAKHVVRPVAKVLALMLAGVWGASDPVRAQGTPQTYWNGNKATPDGVVAGGPGTWSATGVNWTDAAGNASGPYDPDGVLYFTGNGADVTVDNSAGQVAISGGLWFDADNYAIVGDALQLTGDVSVGLRLDDLASASFAVSIRSDLTGDGALTLIGGREVALTGNNTYTGGTTIERGNLYLDRGSIYHPDADLVLIGEEFGRLSITNGGKVTTGNGYIGDAGSGSEVFVTGSGSQWVNNENIYVDGFLNIASQGTVETGGDVFIAHSSEDGAVSVSDGATLDLGENDLYVGYNGVGTLNIGSSGRVEAAGTIIAGRITTGSGSGYVRFNQTDDITFSTPIQGNILVEQRGYGSTTLTGEHSYANGTRVINGTLVLDGATVHHPGADAVVAASTNNGLLRIDNGASLTSLNGLIADDPFGANGDVVVAGPGSSWTMMGNLSMGSETYSALRSSRLLIEDGATVSNVNSFLREQTTVTIDGADSLWSNTGTITFGGGGLHIGAADLSGTAGTVTADLITGYGSEIRFNQTDDLTFAVPIDGSIGIRHLGYGTTTLTADSRVRSISVNNGSLILDGSSFISGSSGISSGDLHLLNGATLQSSQGILTQGTATATVSGAGSAWVTTSEMRIGANNGNGTLRIEAGGQVRNEGSRAIIGSDPDGRGNAVVTGAGSNWTIENDLILGYDERNDRVEGPGGVRVVALNSGQGSLLIDGGGKVSSRRAFIGFGSDNQEDKDWVLLTNASGVLTVADSGSLLEVTGDIDLGHNGATGTLNIGHADLSGTAGTISASQIITGYDPLDLPEDYDPWPFPFPAEPTAGTGTVNFNQTDNTTFSVPMHGNISVNQRGRGSTVLLGKSTYTGATTVSDGTLRVNGSIASSHVTVQSGATLGGSGTVGHTTVLGGATIAPGNSIGRTTVAGDLTLAAGSIYEVETDPQSDASDQIDVGGVANIDGAIVQHIGESGVYKPFSRYNILTADGGVNGRFGSVTSVFAFLDPQLDYDTNNVYLELRRNDVRFSSTAVSLNQRNAADGLASLDRNSSVYQHVLMTERDAAPATFDALSGDSLLASVNAGYELQRNFGALLRRRGGPPGDSFSPRGSEERLAQKGTQGGANVWVQAGTSRLKEDVERAVGNAQYVMQGNAMAAGVEAGNDGWLMGVAGSAVSADLGFSNRQASGDMNAYFLGGYGRWQSETGGYVRGGLSYGRVNTKAQRTFNQRTIKSDFGMHGLRADVEAGVQIPWQRLNVTPYVQVSSTWLRREGFRERGSSGAELSVDATKLATRELTLGVDVSAPFQAGALDGFAWGGVAAVKRFDDTQAVQSAAFRAGSERFKVYSADMGDTRAQLNLGVKIMSGRQLSFEASYFGHQGQAGTQHGGAVGLAYRW